MSLHDPKKSRHGRVFELLRQTDSAIEASGVADAVHAQEHHVADLDAIKKSALRSFDRSGVIDRATKAGRDDKLF